MTHPNIQLIIDAQTDEELLSLFRMGFELEVQSVSDMQEEELFEYLRGEYAKNSIDKQAYDAAVLRNVELFKLSPGFISDLLRNRGSSWLTNLAREHPQYLNLIMVLSTAGSSRQSCVLPASYEAGFDLSAAVRGSTSQIVIAAISEVVRDGYDCAFFVDKNRFLNSQYAGLTEAQVYAGSLTEYASGFELLSVGTDGSVRGAEIRTAGALTIEQFNQARELVFDIPDLDIDRECSFHVHLSVPGVRHSYSSDLQRAAISYLVANRDQIPIPVRKRFRDSSWMGRYYAAILDADKYRLVASRGSTWEYRGWGNVTDPDEAYQCLLLSAKAQQHAYRVTLGGAAALFPSVQRSMFAEFVSDSLRDFEEELPATESAAGTASELISTIDQASVPEPVAVNDVDRPFFFTNQGAAASAAGQSVGPVPEGWAAAGEFQLDEGVYRYSRIRRISDGALCTLCSGCLGYHLPT